MGNVSETLDELMMFGPTRLGEVAQRHHVDFDAIMAVLDELLGTDAGDKVGQDKVMRARDQHRANKVRVAELTSTLEGMRAYVKGEREARFCTSDAIQDLLDQLFMQCLDHVPEYANFIKAAEEQHAATQCTIAELKASLAGSLEERAALAHEVAEERAEVEHFKARAEKAERLSRQHFKKLVKLAAEVGRCWCTHEAGDSPCPTHGMEEDES